MKPPFLSLLVMAAVFGGSVSSLCAQTPSAAPAPSTAVAPTRERLLMDFDWKFNLGEAADAGTKFDYPEPTRLDKTIPKEIGLREKLDTAQPDPVATNLGSDVSFVQPTFDDSKWRTLDVPHDWAIELPFDEKADSFHGYHTLGKGYAANNIGWYRRTFDLPATDKDKTLWLEFDGVYRNSIVWLNGHCLGRNLSGYSSFYFDISKVANYGGKNTVAVRVDASRAEGWFYEGAGIYRHVWLVKTLSTHIAHDGVFVYSKFKDNTPVGAAEIHGQVQLESRPPISDDTMVNFQVLDPDGKEAAKTSAKATADLSPVLATMTLNTPVLWSPDTPKLYALVTTVTVGGKVIDEMRTPFGIRTVAFDPNKGFILNGKPCFINGTCNHQDFAGVGLAIPDRVQAYRVARLREMGSNGWRTAHNIPAPELLDECDKQGMLVLDENRRMDLSAGTLDELKRMILRDRNHPSIFAWSLGNEEGDIQGRPEGVPVAAAMTKVVHDLDPTRPDTAAMSAGWGKGFTDSLDVMGLNYTHEGDPDVYHAANPTKPIMNTETGSSLTSRGVYDGHAMPHYSLSYDDAGTHGNQKFLPDQKKNLTAEQWEQYYMARPWISSVFIWVGQDYRGENHWPLTVASMGAIDQCGYPKDLFYYFQSAWGTKPMLHLFPHWNYQGKEGHLIRIVANTNCDEVELFLNGTSQGKQTVPKLGHVEWKIPYAQGTLSAVAYTAGKKTLETKIETTGVPVAIQLVPDRTDLHGDGRDVGLITAQTVDDQGRVVPNATNEIHFHVDGGKLIGVGNGDPGSHEMDNSDTRTLFSGLAMAIIQAPRQGGKITITADSPGLSSATATLNADASGPAPFVP